MNIGPKKLLSQLVANHVINQESADKYELTSIQKSTPIYDYLLSQPELPKNEILKAAAQLLDIPYVDLSSSPIDPQALSMVPEATARRHLIIPYKFDPKTQSLYVATLDPFSTQISEFLERKTSKKIVLALAYLEDIKNALAITYAQGLSPEVSEALKEYQPGGTPKTVEEDIGSIIKEAPIAKIVSTILEFAVKSRSSDIHVEGQELKTRVRYRIDGVLHEKLTLPKSIHDAVVSRIKILSGMKIDEKRIPQDGRFNIKFGGEEIDLRVSTLPTVNGEKVVMRLLKKTGGIPTLYDLGLQGPPFRALEEVILKPYGIVLVTGPTGSGKTTTLYSILTRLNSPTVNIMTIEDPVEYQMSGMSQVQINTQAGLTFASGLRAFLRQDPNIILVGEIRDKETTQLAIQAALTGHLVFSTLHTNDAATAIPRLIDLGGEPFLIASVLNATLGQRICRKTCSSCREEYVPEPAVVANIKEVLGDFLPKQYKEGQSMHLTRGRGCAECAQTGFLGRIGIFELLRTTPTINKMILESKSGKEIEKQAKTEGLIVMKQDGYLKALDGVTTIEEVLRVAEV